MTGNRNLAVGLFVTAALVIGISLTIWITGLKGTEPTKSYSVLVEGNVSGLSLGGPVYFLGVKVGEVTQLLIVSGDPTQIKVDIRVAASAPVNEGTWATLAPQGITGVSVVNLANDPGQHPLLETTADGPLPVIPYRDSGFSALLSSAPAILDKVEHLVDQANYLFGDENRELVVGTLANIESLSQALREEEAALAALPANIDRSLGEINRLSNQLSQLLDEAAPGVLASLENIENTSAQLASTTSRLEAWASQNDQQLQAFMGDGLGQVPELIADSRQALRTLEKLLEQLKEEPSSIVRERPLETIEWKE